MSAGAGQVRFSGHEGPASYAIEGEAARLRLGTARLRGRLELPAEVAEAAFRAGEGVLTLEDGVQLRIVMLGHTAGGGEVFIEVRV